MEKYYYRGKEVLAEILAAQGFAAGAEDPSGLGRSIRFTKDAFQVAWVFDLRDQMFILQVIKDKKTVGQAFFGGGEKLEGEVIAKLRELLSAQGIDIPEQ